MKASRFTEAKAFILKQGEVGTPFAAICRTARISPATFFKRKKRYAGLLPKGMKRLKQLEGRNGRLKKAVAVLTLDRGTLQDIIRRKLCGLSGSARLSTRCWWTGACRSGGHVTCQGPTRRAAISDPAAPGRTALNQASGDMRNPCALRLPAHPCAAETRGLSGEHQEGDEDLQ